MTIAMAFKCKNGAIVATDRQGLRDGGAASVITKIFPVSGGGALGFSTNDMNWVSEFMSMLNRRQTGNTITRFKATAKRYEIEARSWGQTEANAEANYWAVYATHNEVYDLHKGAPPAPPTEFDRVLAGHPTAVSVASVFIRSVEWPMGIVRPHGTWSNYSTKFVARFCWLLLGIMESHTAAIRGRDIYEIKKGKEPRRLTWDDIKGDGTIEGDTTEPFFAFLDSIWEEISPNDLVKMDKATKMLPPALRDLFYMYGVGREEWN